MTPNEARDVDRGRVLSRSRVLVVMGSYFLLTGVLQAFIPLRAAALGAKGAIVGLLLVLAGGGIGLITDMGFAALADARGHDKVVFRGFLCILTAVSLVVLDGSVVALFVGCFFAGLGISAVFDPLLAMLTTTPHHHSQARTQGFNVTTQRCGALLAAVMIGVALATRHDEILVLSAIVACLVPLAVIHLGSTKTVRPRRPVMSNDYRKETKRLLVDGYRQGIKMFRRRRIILAALVSVAVNLIFIETNSFVPLIGRHHGLRQAVVITAALVARDIVAIIVGIWTVATGRHASSWPVVGGVLLLSAVCAIGVGVDSDAAHDTLIFWCGLQGVAIGVGIAAMNLLTVGASSQHQRALGMAAATLINRAGVVVIPLALGLSLQLQGLRAVFFVVSATLIALCLVFVGFSLGLEDLVVPADPGDGPTNSS